MKYGIARGTPEMASSTSVPDSESDECDRSSSVVSLLDRLKCPTAAAIARKRKIKINPPTTRW